MRLAVNVIAIWQRSWGTVQRPVLYAVYGQVKGCLCLVQDGFLFSAVLFRDGFRKLQCGAFPINIVVC